MPKKEQRKEKSYLETVTNKIGEIAMHFGFSIIKSPQITSQDHAKSRQFKEFDHYGDAVEKVALTHWYMNERLDLETQPVAIHFKKPLPGHPLKKKPNQEIFGLEIMGSTKSTSEALLLRCLLSILEELGHTNIYIDINSIGDRDSIAKFERDLANHMRKNGHTLSAKLKQDFKKNYHNFLKNLTEAEKEFSNGLPESIGSLSDLGRNHLKEVLECLESFGILYKIRPKVLSNKLYAAYTVFEIREIPKNSEEAEGGELLAYGYRYNHLAKKLGNKREIPSIGATLILKKEETPQKKLLIKNIKRPRLFLAQIGGVAKLKALNIVEILRKNKIPVYHSITKDKITGQLNGAEYVKASHVLIMGQKEALDNTIVVRDLGTREQDTVSIPELAEFLKKVVKSKR